MTHYVDRLRILPGAPGRRCRRAAYRRRLTRSFRSRAVGAPRRRAPISAGTLQRDPPRSRAVAIWINDDGRITVQYDDDEEKHWIIREGEDGDAWHQFACETWSRLLPVTEEAYQHFLKEGNWPDEHPAVTRSNNAPPDDTLEAIDERIKDLSARPDQIISKVARL
jgi:hypothetical protein